MQLIDDRILSIFKQRKNTYVSGEELSRVLGISRAGIWKHIKKIKEQGYTIIASPHLGYRLVSVPDRLIPTEVQYELNTHIIGKKIYSYQILDSTNDTAQALAIKGAEQGTVVIAESQSRGRGRLGRPWASPKGKGIYLSVILNPKLPPSATSKITLLASVATAMAIRRISSLPSLIKWPNDIIIKNKKVSGILTEIAAQPDTIKFLILGIGINVNTPKELLPPGATSISQELGQSISRIILVQELLRQIEKYYLLFNHKGFEAIISEWQNLSATLGSRVKVTDLENFYEGQAIGIDKMTGGLIVREDNGFTHTVLSGDVENLE
jgi:BirA family biotin operon repressor/biotin-[acetyl-CoA-carboxylase] ligase